MSYEYKKIGKYEIRYDVSDEHIGENVVDIRTPDGKWDRFLECVSREDVEEITVKDIEDAVKSGSVLDKKYKKYWMD